MFFHSNYWGLVVLPQRTTRLRKNSSICVEFLTCFIGRRVVNCFKRSPAKRHLKKRTHTHAFLWFGCFQKHGKNPQIIHFNRVFHYFHHPCWGVYHPYFWFNTHFEASTGTWWTNAPIWVWSQHWCSPLWFPWALTMSVTGWRKISQAVVLPILTVGSDNMKGKARSGRLGKQQNMGVSKIRVFYSQITLFNRVSIIFTIHFGGFTTPAQFLETPQQTELHPWNQLHILKFQPFQGWCSVSQKNQN